MSKTQQPTRPEPVTPVMDPDPLESPSDDSETIPRPPSPTFPLKEMHTLGRRGWA